MQIVIDIPEMTLLNITSRELLLCSREDIEKLEFAIKNGTPLKNITNEINNLASSPNANSAWYRVAIIDCLKVIDKLGRSKNESGRT